ncbi:hypothetical protein [Streptomyces lunalinharesii]|uniref:MarR family transcriptional regulator n=1 Tax=Streptomyces lunalinharesii TaxID=333384 RepID=A0ABN3RPN3_9ACTN
MSAHIPHTQRLARTAFTVAHHLNSMRGVYRSHDIRMASDRLKQLAHLALGAADHLLDAHDLLSVARDRAEQADAPAPHHALWETGRRLELVRQLTAHGAQDCVNTSALVGGEFHRQRLLPAQPSSLSAAQQAALILTGLGHVSVDSLNDKAHTSQNGTRLTIATIRSLEARGLVTREPVILHEQRVHLKGDGYGALTAVLAHPRRTAPATALPARPAHTANHSRTR